MSVTKICHLGPMIQMINRSATPFNSWPWALRKLYGPRRSHVILNHSDPFWDSVLLTRKTPRIISTGFYWKRRPYNLRRAQGQELKGVNSLQKKTLFQRRKIVPNTKKNCTQQQLLDARVINFVQQTLTSSVTHETIDRLLRKIANHKIMIVEPKLKRTLLWICRRRFQ
jgi:hypothetical protein